MEKFRKQKRLLIAILAILLLMFISYEIYTQIQLRKLYSREAREYKGYWESKGYPNDAYLTQFSELARNLNRQIDAS